MDQTTERGLAGPLVLPVVAWSQELLHPAGCVLTFCFHCTGLGEDNPKYKLNVELLLRGVFCVSCLACYFEYRYWET
jgi:hypothetical protein